jgi:hypothetical protein
MTWENIADYSLFLS